MKLKLAKFLAVLGLLTAIVPLALFAQGTVDAGLGAPGAGTTPPAWLLNLVAKWPVLSTVIVVIGGLRLLVKPFVAFAHWVVDRTDTPKDNEWIERVENSKFLKALSFVLDWAASIKLVRK